MRELINRAREEFYPIDRDAIYGVDSLRQLLYDDLPLMLTELDSRRSGHATRKVGS